MSKYFLIILLSSATLWGHQCKNVSHIHELSDILQDTLQSNKLDSISVQGDEVSNPYQRYILHERDIFLCIMFEGEYVYMREEVATRGKCTFINNKYLFFDHKDLEWATFDPFQKEVYEYYLDKNFSLDTADINDISQNTVAQRLLMKNPYLTWFDSDVHFTLKEIDKIHFSAQEIEPIMSYIRMHTNQGEYNQEVRYQWYDRWVCAFDENPIEFKSWLTRINEDFMGSILYVNSLESEQQIQNQIREKLQSALNNAPLCLKELEKIIY